MFHVEQIILPIGKIGDRLVTGLRLAGVEVSAPTVPVIHNTDVREHADADGIREALVAQLHSPVRWVESIQAMKARGVTMVAELGPGKVLTGLMRRIDRDMDAKAVFDPASLDAAIEAAGA